MKETICTIPINDIFMPKCGCPFCRMESMLEEQYVKFITGDAMMEPNIRIETNKKGFCHRHFSQMFEKGQKLPNALILESHLQEIIDNDMPKKLKGKPDKKQLEVIKKRPAGTNESFPNPEDCSIAGISRLHMEAATITPAAKPVSAL